MFEDDELLDSGLLESIIGRMLDQGKRNFAIDLSVLDYIYSDSMNKFLAINRRVLDVSGRLSLLSPNQEVRQILERAGIHNFLRIYDTEEDLIRSSDDIIKQTQTISLSSIRAVKKQSEFEDFRNEIGNSIQLDSGDDQPQDPPRNSQPHDPRNFQAPASQPNQRPPMPNQPPQGFAPPRPQQPPQQPPRPQQPPQGFAPQRPGPGPGGMPPRPPQQHGPEFGPPRQRPPQGPAQGPGRPAVPPQQQGPGDPFGRRDPQQRQPHQEPTKIVDDDRLKNRDIIDDDDDIEIKKFPIGPLIAAILALALIGGGVYAYISFMRGDANKLTAAKSETPVTEMPQLSTEPDSTAQDSLAAAGESEDDKVEVKEESTSSPSRTASAPRRSSTPSPSRTVRRTTSSTPSRPARTSNKITFTSTPNGASILVDGKSIGTTPYTWDNPSVYGTVLVEVEKNGFESGSKRFEYTGGVSREHFVLNEAAPEPERQATRTQPQPQPQSSPSASAGSSQPERQQVSTPPSPTPRQEPVADTTPQNQTPASSTPPAASQPSQSVASSAPASSPSSSPAKSTGDPGSIFIASIPPVADVYMDGQKIGKTNIAELNVKSGTHMMRFVKGAKEIEKEMTFKAGKNPSQMVRIP